MTLFQLFIGFLLLISWVIRPLLYKPIAEYFPAKQSATFTSFWLVFSLILTYPILGHFLQFNGNNALFSPYILISVYKGVALFYFVTLQQIINKKSLSSSVFLSFIAMALGSLVNNLFFAENLGITKVFCICGFGILGILFLYKGDAKRLSHKDIFFFFIATIIMASFSISDHIAIPKVGWYAHLLVSSIIMCLSCFLYKISRLAFKMVFKDKRTILAGVFYAVTEFLVIYASINILPVSIVALFLRLSVPIVMIISALRYKEQNLKNQLIFGILAILLALPIIL
ncbi:MAG: hypothetical protein E7020_03400 [Alphaproteobacteria bacterium]|nr:hypothetical protein [Alphaproteobacteria bacterium]